MADEITQLKKVNADLLGALKRCLPVLEAVGREAKERPGGSKFGSALDAHLHAQDAIQRAEETG